MHHLLGVLLSSSDLLLVGRDRQHACPRSKSDIWIGRSIWRDELRDPTALNRSSSLYLDHSIWKSDDKGADKHAVCPPFPDRQQVQIMFGTLKLTNQPTTAAFLQYPSLCFLKNSWWWGSSPPKIINKRKCSTFESKIPN